MVGLNPGPISLPARPPTPPRESTTKHGISGHSDPFATTTNPPVIYTPDESPSSSAEYSKTFSEKAQKRVGFSPWTDFHRLPSTGGKDSDSDSSIRRLPRSKDCKSLKSILKACTVNTTMQSDSEHLNFDQTDLIGMLRSTAHHLGSNSRAPRIESYTTLLACLGAHDDIPETREMSEQVVKITEYMRRDVCAKVESDGSLDIQLAIQALKVLTAFLYWPSIASVLPDDFCTFILDRSLSSIEDPSSPKILVSHYLQILEKQKFTSKQMNTDRVNRLLSALDLVTTRVKGNRVVCHRLMIYQRLLVQAKSVMACRIGNWIDHLISAMLSSIKDVRVRAISFGTDAGLQLGQISSVSQACIEVFNRASQEGKKVIDYLASCLIEMVNSKDNGVHVPQIWSIVILFLRSRKRQLECWEHIKTWLVVIQRCLNSNEPQVKFQANIAWSRLIFAINPDTSTSESMAKMLRQPMMSQLELKANDRISKQAKQITRSTYCTLLYYAFRPTATHAQLDQYWELYIPQIKPSSSKASRSDINYACDILAALLSSNGKSKIWDENRANTSGPVKTEELPCLDPKWIRSRASNITQIFGKLFDLADWHSNKDPRVPVLVAWQSFMTALGTASSKEVKVSIDTMTAVAYIINLLKRCLEETTTITTKSIQKQSSQQQDSNQGKQCEPFEKFRILLAEAVNKIGTIPFMERRVILTSQNSFEAAGTPSSRSTKNSGSLDSPVMHLLRILLTRGQDEQVCNTYADSLRAVMQISLQTAFTRQTQLCILRRYARLLSPDAILEEQASLAFEQLLAEAFCSCLQMPQQDDLRKASPHYSGSEFRDAVKILEVGIRRRSLKNIPAWREMHECVVRTLRKEIGDEGITLAMTMPLAEVVQGACSTCDDALLIAASTVMKATHWPQSPQQVEKAHKLLWGTVGTSIKATPVVLDGLYAMIDTLLASAYRCLAELSANNVILLLSTLTTSLGTCSPLYQETFLSRIQRGVVAWIEDINWSLGSSKCSEPVDLSSEVDKMWATVMVTIDRLSEHSTRTLTKFQEVLLSGLRSRRKAIVNRTLMLWNQTFGCAQVLEYPEDLRKELLKLRSLADIQLPTLPEAETDEVFPLLQIYLTGSAYANKSKVTSSPVRFLELQNDEAPAQELLLSGTPGNNVTGGSLRPTAKTAIIPMASPSPIAASDSPFSAQREYKTTPKARLRHNDSQIQFAAIESSPLAAGLGDSQDLTDRQKEVRERQGLEVAMFPEIRSSPKSVPRHAEYSLPRLILKSKPNDIPIPTMDEQISPMCAPNDLMNDFLGSSPTPASSKKGPRDTQSDDDAQSSPPYAASPCVSHESPAALFAVYEPNQALLTRQEDASNHERHENLASVEIRADTGLEYNNVNKANKISNEEEITISAAPALPPDDRIMSDHEVFVDALSEPLQNIQDHEDTTNISAVLNSSPSDRPSDFLSEDDQVTAQLVGEMERASSQQSGRQDEMVNASSPSGRKRKGSASDDVVSSKKARYTSTSYNPQGSGTPRAGESVAECVLIEVRQVEGESPTSLRSIKKERSQSPSSIASIPSNGHNSEPASRRSRPSGKSRASQLSPEASSVRVSPRLRQVKPESAVNNASMADAIQKRARKSARLSGLFTRNSQQHSTSPFEDKSSEPDSVTKYGRRKASKRWFWSTEESPEKELQPGNDTVVSRSSISEAKRTVERNQLSGSQRLELLPGEQEPRRQTSEDCCSEVPVTNVPNETVEAEGAHVEASGDQPTARGILQSFRTMVDNIKRIAIGHEEEREMIGLLFESVKEVHEAGRRHSAM